MKSIGLRPMGAMLLTLAITVVAGCQKSHSPDATAGDFTDALDKQTANWTPTITGKGPSINFENGHMVHNYPADTDRQGNISVLYMPNFLLVGDFDAQVDYQIDQYKPVDGYPVSGLRVQMSFNTTSAERVGWENVKQDVYTANQYWHITTVPTSDLRGTLRLVRKDGQVFSYYKSQDDWKLIASTTLKPEDLGPVQVKLSSGFPGYAFPGVAEKAEFSNFRVKAQKINGLDGK